MLSTIRNVAGVSVFFLLFLLFWNPSTTVMVAGYNNNNSIRMTIQPPLHYSRRSILQKSFVSSFIRIAAAGGTTTAVVVLTTSIPVQAQEETSDKDGSSAVHDAFQRVRMELEDPNTGGVQYLQNAIDREDFASVLEFSKQYDLQLRKAGMVRAKKLLTDKEAKEKGTTLANNVTFDLIGINRSCRPGPQQSKEDAQKYLDELKQDVKQFLELEPKGI